MKTLVLGCGPAGLIAAHAAATAGSDVLIFSKARKSYMFGAQYLHAPIPFVTEHGDKFKVRYELRGTAEGYRRKVYGDGPGAPVAVSAEDLRGVHPAWDIRAAYDRLWDAYGPFVQDVDIKSPEEIDRLITWASADIVISTMPAPLLCLEGHTFASQAIWSTGQESVIPFHPNNNTVVVNGEPAPAWYRASRIQGHTTIEWPEHFMPPIRGMHKVQKPIKTNCSCFPDVVRMGRYGKWQKGVLSHEAYLQTRKLLHGKGVQEALF